LPSVALVAATADAVAVNGSPTLPADTLLPVTFPTIPAGYAGVIALVAWSVVNLPAAAAVVPIAGGEAK
jgi:hypothetical protein